MKTDRRADGVFEVTCGECRWSGTAPNRREIDEVAKWHAESNHRGLEWKDSYWVAHCKDCNAVFPSKLSHESRRRFDEHRIIHLNLPAGEIGFQARCPSCDAAWTTDFRVQAEFSLWDHLLLKHSMGLSEDYDWEKCRLTCVTEIPRTPYRCRTLPLVQTKHGLKPELPDEQRGRWVEL